MELQNGMVRTHAELMHIRLAERVVFALIENADHEKNQCMVLAYGLRLNKLKPGKRTGAILILSMDLTVRILNLLIMIFQCTKSEA